MPPDAEHRGGTQIQGWQGALPGHPESNIRASVNTWVKMRPNGFPSSARPLSISEPQGLGSLAPGPWPLALGTRHPYGPGQSVVSMHRCLSTLAWGPWFRAKAGSILLTASVFETATTCFSTFFLGASSRHDSVLVTINPLSWSPAFTL